MSVTLDNRDAAGCWVLGAGDMAEIKVDRNLSASSDILVWETKKKEVIKYCCRVLLRKADVNPARDLKAA